MCHLRKHCALDITNLAWSMPSKKTNRLHGRPGGIRTPITRIWSPVLYPLELLACFIVLRLRFEDRFALHPVVQGFA
jgi:hypothetical protein